MERIKELESLFEKVEKLIESMTKIEMEVEVLQHDVQEMNDRIEKEGLE